MRNTFCRAALLLLVALPAGAQSDPSSLPARDAHDGLTIAADPYADAARYKTRFGKKTPYDAGIVAIEVFFRNDNDKPIRVDLETIRLLLRPPGADRQRLDALTLEEVADRILNKGGPNPTVRRRPIPVPGGGAKPRKSKEWDELVAALRKAAVETDVLPPRSSVHGFLFFDIGSRYDWIPYARLYIADLKFMTDNKPLLFFELDLGAARRR